MVALQAAEQTQSDDLLLLAASLIAVGLALFITFHAYRGYRRNDSVRMWYLAAGLALITVVPMTLSIGVTSLGQVVGLQPRVRTFYLPILSRVSEIVGLCSLLYSLLVTPGGSSER
ncbi:DUF7521 family protein [Haloarcula amylovorans]|uniref:DUF7521 family protein n=1 Tax=Haloarcula amylovorans TaxID=2562280 RepID=UPI0010762C22|nr:hypothetical protein [Halomicroarcula amylolytica]